MESLKLTAIITATLSPTLTEGHAFLTVPASRNVNDYCAHCLNAGGPAVVHANDGYVHGICGNSPTDTAQNWNQATEPTAIGYSGDSFLVEVTVTAHHLGFFEFELCDSPNITEKCFRSNRLMRSNCNIETEGEAACRRWWKPLNSDELNHYSLQPQGYPDGAPYSDTSTCYTMQYRTYFDLPTDVSCTHCVLRWHYHTTNSCTSSTSHSEEFWNCADVSVMATHRQTVNTNPDSMLALNAELVLRAPEDLASARTSDDFWDCPDPAYGNTNGYTCSIDASAEDISGCAAYTGSWPSQPDPGGETCVIKYYENTNAESTDNPDDEKNGLADENQAESQGTPRWSYCAWYECQAKNNTQSTLWCDQSQERCSTICAGTWCQGFDNHGAEQAEMAITTLAEEAEATADTAAVTRQFHGTSQDADSTAQMPLADTTSPPGLRSSSFATTTIQQNANLTAPTENDSSRTLSHAHILAFIAAWWCAG